MYKTILEQIQEVEQIIAHNEGAGYEHELDRLLEALSKMDKKVVWASPHYPTGEQIRSLEGQGCIIQFLSDIDPDLFKELSNLSLDSDRPALAEKLLSMTVDVIVQPAGDPAFQYYLGAAAKEIHLAGGETPAIWHAFSKRVSKDIPQEDGAVKNVSVFQFEDWI